MLAKLFHHEFRNTAKVMLLLYALAGIVTVMTISINFFDDRLSSMPDPARSLSAAILGAMIALYVLSLFALFVVTIVYLCLHFYRTMYSDQGYLTHTLPVSPMATLNVKLVTALVWVLGAIAVIFLSVFVLFIGVAGADFFTEFRDFFGSLNEELYWTGLTPLKLLWYLFITMIIHCISWILMVYACLSIGQLFPHKIAASIVTGIVVYFVKRLISSIFTFTLMLSWTDILWSDGFEQLPWFIWAVNGLAAAFAIGFYVTCAVIVQKHINLD